MEDMLSTYMVQSDASSSAGVTKEHDHFFNDINLDHNDIENALSPINIAHPTNAFSSPAAWRTRSKSKKKLNTGPTKSLAKLIIALMLDYLILGPLPADDERAQTSDRNRKRKTSK